MIALRAVIGRTLVAQEVRTVATKWLEYPTALRVVAALALSDGEGDVLARHGGARHAVREALLVG